MAGVCHRLHRGVPAVSAVRHGGELGEIERLGDHRQVAVGVPRPFRLRAVAVELDAVAVRVAQVERLGDSVVGGSVERDAGGEQSA